MTIGRYPPNKYDDLTKLFLGSDKPKYPDFVKKLHNWVAQVSESKYKIYAVYECPDDKLIEGLTAITRRYHYYASVEGYEFKIELITDAVAAIKAMSGK